MTKGVIFYTDNAEYPFSGLVRGHIAESRLSIVSVSLKPLDFGKNIVMNMERGYKTMVAQIFTALEASDTDYVFFCEHDVIYPKSHFEFTPPRDDIFYYNSNVWRWEFGSDTAIRYDRMLPLSCLCVNRQLAYDHYKLRIQAIDEAGAEAFASNEPVLARRWGYEPGTKKRRRGGLTDDDFETWQSKEPIIDIRHDGTFSPPKITLESFRHPPTGWEEISVDEVPYWDLKSITTAQ